jgi:hypothetical protein
MSLDARFALLLAPLFAVLDANAARALENADFAGLVNIGGVAGSISIESMNESNSAECLRRHRQRRRNGLRCLTIELRETEITKLIREGFLAAETRNDSAPLQGHFTIFSIAHWEQRRNVQQTPRQIGSHFLGNAPIAVQTRYPINRRRELVSR